MFKLNYVLLCLSVSNYKYVFEKVLFMKPYNYNKAQAISIIPFKTVKTNHSHILIFMPLLHWAFINPFAANCNVND